MKRLVSLGAFLMLVGGVVTGCGSPAITCQSATCSNTSGKSYQVCSHVTGTVSYDYGGESCDCTPGNQAQCNRCAMAVASYCSTGTGGGAGGGGGGGGTASACTAKFSGAFSSTYTACSFSITVAQSSWALDAEGNALPGTSYTWTGLHMSFDGTDPVPGTVDQTGSKGSSTFVDVQVGGAWVASFDRSATAAIGALSATITDLGPETFINGNPFYQQPHGSVTALLKSMGAPPGDENLSITF